MGSSMEVFPSSPQPPIDFSHKSDKENLAQDWERVGSYMFTAIGTVDEEQAKRILS